VNVTLGWGIGLDLIVVTCVTIPPSVRLTVLRFAQVAHVVAQVVHAQWCVNKASVSVRALTKVMEVIVKMAP